tara:strand:- start:2096 stop:2845 length:750 start_codon:yes stop_codon:yes gene_type:complete
MSFRQYEIGLVRFSQVVVPGDLRKDGTTVPDSIVPMVVTNPDRAFAELAKHLHLKDTSKVPLPMMSIQLLDPVFQPERIVGSRKYRTGMMQSTVDLNRQKHFGRAQPYQFGAQIDLWAADRRQIDFLLATYMLKFDPDYAYLKVSHRSERAEYLDDDTEEIGFSDVLMTLDGITDNSDLEPPLESNIEHRRTISLTIQGWLIPEPVEVPSVRSVVVTETVPAKGVVVSTADELSAIAAAYKATDTFTIS